MRRLTSTLSLSALLFVLAAHARAGDEPAADGWTFAAARDEIAPAREVLRDSGDALYGLVLEGRGKQTDGRWQKTVPVTAGKHYAFRTLYQADKVADVRRSVLARVIWLDAAGKQLGSIEFPRTTESKEKNGWSMLAATYLAPEKAAQARLELHLRWAEAGRVEFRHAGLTESAPPAPRKVRLAAVNHRPAKGSTPAANLDAFATRIDEAGAQRADVVCLGEGITVVGTKLKYADVAEAIPGPSTEALGKAAARNKLYVVAGLYERDGPVVYNTSVLIGRDGKLIGKYRKVCLPREEIDGGITPGEAYPVFDTDFGRVGMMICWDVHFPEVARELAAQGAEVILLPIWGGNETLARARAIENQVHLVASGYDFKTAIYDRRGEPLAVAQSDPAVLVAEVDLEERVYWPWLGDWRSRIWREGPVRAVPAPRD